MPLLGLEKVVQKRKIAVDGIEEPEVGHVSDREVREFLPFLAARAAEGAALCSHDLHESPENVDQILVGGDVQHWRYKLLVVLEAAVWGPLDSGNAQSRSALTQLFRHQQAEILARHQDR